jgi:hypothetical protein
MKNKVALLSYGMSGKVFHAPFWNFTLDLNCLDLGKEEIDTTRLS